MSLGFHLSYLLRLRFHFPEQQKFYRVSGNSTQNRGVVPDINLPSLYDVNEVGESALPGALPWDTIRAAKYNAYSDFSGIIPRLQTLHENRSAKDPDFKYLVKLNEIVEQRRDIKTISLNEQKRLQEKKVLEEKQLAIENERRKSKNMPLVSSLDDLDKHAEENDTESGNDETPLLTESGNILIDFITLNYPQLAKH